MLDGRLRAPRPRCSRHNRRVGPIAGGRRLQRGEHKLAHVGFRRSSRSASQMRADIEFRARAAGPLVDSLVSEFFGGSLANGGRSGLRLFDRKPVAKERPP
jgi:hypothetical protein